MLFSKPRIQEAGANDVFEVSVIHQLFVFLSDTVIGFTLQVHHPDYNSHSTLFEPRPGCSQSHPMPCSAIPVVYDGYHSANY